MTKTDLIQQLAKDGWREYPKEARKFSLCFYKRFDTPTACSGNPNKTGMQIEIAVSDGYACAGVSLALDLCAGLKDGTWMNIHNYSLPKTYEEVIALIPRMLAMWELASTLCNHTPKD
jgi:hypothetical protein